MNKKIVLSLALVSLLAAGCSKTTETIPQTNTPNTSTNSNSNPSKTDTQATQSSDAKVFNMTDVQAANTEAKCWAVVSGKVYDLTNWISKHPGGSKAIKSMCGTDATAAFNDQHGGERRPANELAGFLIGNLSK